MLPDVSSLWPKIAQATSDERLAPYQRRTNGDPQQMLRLYLWNISLCESLYPLLNLTEVTLRNRLDSGLAEMFGRRDWFNLDWLDARDATKVRDAQARILRSHRTPTPGRVVAELTFGFWASLLDVRYERTHILWPHLAQQVFACAPRKLRSRKAQSRAAASARDLRNRVFHHEPIWHWPHLPEIVQDAARWLDGLSPEAAVMVRLLDRFHQIFSAGPGLAASQSRHPPAMKLG